MLQLTFLWLGTVAFLVTIGTFSGAMLLEVRGDVRHMIDVLGGFAGVVLWALWGLAATNIEVVSNGSVVTNSATALGFVAAIMAGISLMIALVGVSSIVNVLGESPRETPR